MRRVLAACTAFAVAALMLLAGLSGCSPDNPINSPYPDASLARNTLYTAFAGRSPKYLDPASSYSTDETPYTYNIYEPLYGYHYLRRPYTLVPRAAASIDPPRYLDAQGHVLPADAPGDQIAQSDYIIRIRPGIRYQPHPALARRADGSDVYDPVPAGVLARAYAITDFKQTGTRELTAQDYVYGFRRLASPRVVSPIFALMAQYVVGLKEYGDVLRKRDAALRQGLPAGTRDLPWLDLRPADGFTGVQALDDHTLLIRVKGKYPQFKYWLAMTFTAPVPWEADRFYSQPGMAEHDLSLNTWPIGTGPYMLVQNLPNRRLVLQRNPNFHGEPYPCEGAPGDRARGLLADCGKPTPFIDRIVFSNEKEAVPLSGKFIQGYYDIPQADRGDYGVAMRVAADDSADKARLYREHGIRLPTSVAMTEMYMGFNWLDPVVGRGDTPEQQEKNRKLRLAISIAFDWEAHVAVFENGQAQVAYGPLPPGVLGYEAPPAGYDPQVYDLVDGKPVRKSLAQARRLLAQAGYPDGRSSKTGQPLVLYYDATGGAGGDAQFDWMRRQLARIGIQLDLRATDYNRFQDKMQRGAAQLFSWGWVADYPDAENFLFLLYGPNGKVKYGGENAANYENPEFDRLFEQMKYLDDGPRKVELLRRMVAIVQHDAPWMFGYFPLSGAAYQQWVGNAKPTDMVRNTLQYMKIDPALRLRRVREWNRPIWWPLVAFALAGALAVAAAWRTVKRRDAQAALPAAAADRSRQERA
ncbi:ABC transporter substrate-binding protein [Bordetella sp. FB-8]|uniref:ABC transporter substrate-binding protein n=1 Tax=Bordetella sp. FB-8 TaxID=1159870 RepID=UPI000377BC97|nr:ABC transporter substrate-binding protein [Bordetella sp. FB-8]